MSRKVFPDLGYCMYCGKTQSLSSEHIVPYALGGEVELKASSCGECAAITSKFERTLLRGQFWRARLALELKSRRKHRDAPTHTQIKISVEGQESELEIERDSSPAVISFPIYSVPRLVIGQTADGVAVAGNVAINFGADPVAIAEAHNASELKFTDSTNPYQFAQLLAKIAYGMAVATGATEHLIEPSPLPDVILGKNTRAGDYVGSMTDELTAYPEHLHRVAIFVDEKTGYLVADIQLFSSSQSPRYAVVIGKTRSTT